MDKISVSITYKIYPKKKKSKTSFGMNSENRVLMGKEKGKGKIKGMLTVFQLTNYWSL